MNTASQRLACLAFIDFQMSVLEDFLLLAWFYWSMLFDLQRLCLRKPLNDYIFDAERLKCA